METVDAAEEPLPIEPKDQEREGGPREGSESRTSSAGMRETSVYPSTPRTTGSAPWTLAMAAEKR